MPLKIKTETQVERSQHQKMKPRDQIQAGFKAHRKKIDNLIESLSPGDLADLKDIGTRIYQREFEWTDQMDPESLICRNISHTTWNSFTSFGDRNHASQALTLHWIRTNGIPLDTQALSLSTETGLLFLPDHFASFMAEYPTGIQSFPYHRETNELRSIFKQICGQSCTTAIRKILLPEISTDAKIYLSSVADWWN